MLVLLYFLIFLVNKSVCFYTVISSKLSNVTFSYANGVNGESDLHECQIYEACNVIHNRFWMSSLTERLCRCPNGKECPWKWTTELGNSSVSLNNKSHLKFCSPFTGLDVCTYEREAAKVYATSDTSNSYQIPHNITINCTCPQTHYWRLQKYTYEESNVIVQAFKCVKKRTCETREFCGHIRSDLHSTYYKCTCPQNHLCIFKDKMEENVQELLYSGPAYKAYCIPFRSL